MFRKSQRQYRTAQGARISSDLSDDELIDVEVSEGTSVAETVRPQGQQMAIHREEKQPIRQTKAPTDNQLVEEKPVFRPESEAQRPFKSRTTFQHSRYRPVESDSLDEKVVDENHSVFVRSSSRQSWKLNSPERGKEPRRQARAREKSPSASDPGYLPSWNADEKELTEADMKRRRMDQKTNSYTLFMKMNDFSFSKVRDTVADFQQVLDAQTREIKSMTQGLRDNYNVMRFNRSQLAEDRKRYLIAVWGECRGIVIFMFESVFVPEYGGDPMNLIFVAFIAIVCFMIPKPAFFSVF